MKLPASQLVIRPSTISPTEAAGISIVALTAYTALIPLAQLEAGQTIFINGGSSAVGAAAIQIAKEKGAKVVASASGSNEAFVKALGADEVCTCNLFYDLRTYVSI